MSSTEKKARVHRSRAQWQQLIAEQASSGLGIGALCAAHGLARSPFRNWRRRLEAQDGEVVSVRRPAGFVELAPRPAPAAIARDFELELGDGVVLRIRRS